MPMCHLSFHNPAGVDPHEDHNALRNRLFLGCWKGQFKTGQDSSRSFLPLIATSIFRSRAPDCSGKKIAIRITSEKVPPRPGFGETTLKTNEGEARAHPLNRALSIFYDVLWTRAPGPRIGRICQDSDHIVLRQQRKSRRLNYLFLSERLVGCIVTSHCFGFCGRVCFAFRFLESGQNCSGVGARTKKRSWCQDSRHTADDLPADCGVRP